MEECLGGEIWGKFYFSIEIFLCSFHFSTICSYYIYNKQIFALAGVAQRTEHGLRTKGSLV